jgi:hypothetical protein
MPDFGRSGAIDVEYVGRDPANGAFVSNGATSSRRSRKIVVCSVPTTLIPSSASLARRRREVRALTRPCCPSREQRIGGRGVRRTAFCPRHTPSTSSGAARAPRCSRASQSAAVASLVAVRPRRRSSDAPRTGQASRCAIPVQGCGALTQERPETSSLARVFDP